MEFIALDIETTGFDAEKDQIIEIGCIKFNENEIIDTYESLINPEREIPPIITLITGIKEEHLEGAPTLKKIEEELIRFIGNCPIVGHNISFDVNFLIQKGLPLKNELHDTLQLSSILIPGLPSYSLDTLTRILKIEHINKHRALSDTKASYDLFMILLNKIKEIDEDTLFEINKILDKSTWPLAKLFYSPIEKGGEQKKTTSEEIEQEKYSEQKELSEKDMESFFNKDGPLSKTIKDYESRQTQKEMVTKIVKSFQENHHHMIEAGTGTGKTMAYLLAAIYHALQNNKKIVISTYTKNLQDQIVNKDIPLLEKALKNIDKDLTFKSTLLKGRRNYISIKRLHTLMMKDYYLDHETTFLIKILLWLKQTKTGDLEEVNIQGKEFSLKDDICCDEFTDEKENGEGQNFLRQARLKAERADIIVVNHALALQDAVSESSILPNYEYIIFDEAHHLERVTTDSLTINLSLNSFVKPYEKLIRIFNDLEKSKLIQNVTIKTQQVLSRTEIFFGLLGIFIEKNAAPDAYQSQVMISENAGSSLEWNKVKESAEIINDLNQQLLNELEILTESPEIKNPDTSREIKSATFEIERRTQNIKTVFLTDQWKDRINWTYKTYEGMGCLKSAPLQIGETLDNLFFSEKKGVILTSATLRTDNSFYYLRKSLSLDERFEEAALPSHFDYPDQVKILIPQDLPRPATEGYFKACADIIKDIIIKNGGRTMVLFTAKKALTATYMAIAPELKEQGINILAQGVTGGKGKILQHFKEEPGNAALFGTDSFWEGVDIPGDLLTCLIMQKLPFDPPSDPIIFSRGKKYTDSFNDYQLPRAILKFKQGFGRLIRTHKDKGSMVILDSRVIQNSYGHQFLESLPSGIKVERGDADKIAEML